MYKILQTNVINVVSFILLNIIVKLKKNWVLITELIYIYIVFSFKVFRKKSTNYLDFFINVKYRRINPKLI